MGLPKTARFPGRIEKRRKAALARREANAKLYRKGDATTITASGDVKLSLERAEADIASLRKSLRIKE